MKKELCVIVNTDVTLPLRLGLSQTLTRIFCSRLFYIGYSLRFFYLISYFLLKYVYYYVAYWDSEVLRASSK